MKVQHRQYGFSLWSLIFTLFLIGFVTFTALKLVPVYLEDFSIRSSLESLETETGRDYRGALSVREALLKRLRINDVTRVGKEEISITRDGQLYYVDVDYTVIVPYISNISLQIEFSHSATVRASI